MLKKLLCLYLSILLLGTAQTIRAEPCDSEHCFGSTEAYSGVQLPLLGTTTYRFLGFSIYEAALYARPEKFDGAKVLVLKYNRALSREDFIESSEKILQRDPSVDLQAIQSPLEEFFRLLQPVKKDDSYAMVYTPGKGLSLFLNGNFLGLVSPDRFATAYLNIWLGEHGIDADKAKELLGSVS